MSVRSSNYSHNEDVVLCENYMHISGDPVIGRFQSSEEFWKRVEEGYKATAETNGWEKRSTRSLQARIQLIEKHVRKLHGCITSIEGRHQSGISKEDVMKQALVLFTQDKDPKFKKGWKFHHIWDTIKGFEKFKGAAKEDSKKKPRGHNSSASGSHSQYSEGMASFSLNLGDDDDDGGGGASFNNDDNSEYDDSPSPRPIGMKKSKANAHKGEAKNSLIDKLRYDNQQFMEHMKASSEQLNQHMGRKNALKEQKEENKILFQDSSLIQDPRHRAFVQSEQNRILQKRAQQSSQPCPSATASYSPYFDNLGGSSSDIPEY